LICFATKGDDRIWAYDTKSQFITLLYAAKNHPSPLLRGVDNVIPTADGNLLISEDGDNMQVITLSLSGQVQAFLQLEGHDRSELTGLAFSPDGHRLYVSSQRGPSGQSTDGVIFEISRL
jgi:secreted PhoX family phosphatase